MPNPTAREMRRLADIANDTKKAAEENARRVEEENLKTLARRAGYWREFYKVASSQETEVEITNLAPQDRVHFTQLGFRIIETYKRNRRQTDLENELFALQQLIEANNKEISKAEKIVAAFENIDTTAIAIWLCDNQSLAYACNMEKWFGEELDRIKIRDLHDLQELQTHTIAMLKNSTGAERRKSLKNLALHIEETIKRRIQEREYHSAKTKLKLLDCESKASEHRINEIENNEEDFAQDDTIESIVIISWDRPAKILSNTSVEGFSYVSLKWLCSSDGHDTLEALYNIIRATAARGENQLQITWHSNLNTWTPTVNESPAPKRRFPSWFDFRELMTALGYRLSKHDNSHVARITIKW